MAAKQRNTKTFDAPTCQDFTVRDKSGILGHMRVKPSAVAWKPKGARAFQQLSLDQLANLASEHGKQVQS